MRIYSLTVDDGLSTRTTWYGSETVAKRARAEAVREGDGVRRDDCEVDAHDVGSGKAGLIKWLDAWCAGRETT